MRPMPPPGMKAAASLARQPLTNLLASYAPQNPAIGQNTSNRHMRGQAKRANDSAARSSVLHDYLATV